VGRPLFHKKKITCIEISIFVYSADLGSVCAQFVGRVAANSFEEKESSLFLLYAPPGLANDSENRVKETTPPSQGAGQ
jgi:hypothetical protein